MSETTHKIFVGYTTQTVPTADDMMPEFSAPKNFKDEDKIRENIEQQQERWKVEAANQPYTGTFKQVTIVCPTLGDNGVVKNFKADNRQPFGDEAPLSQKVAEFLLKTFPDQWGTDIKEFGAPEVYFLGFNIRGFLKMLGVECSLPWVPVDLPPAVWFANSDHFDMERAAIPSEYEKTIDWATVVKARRIGLPEEEAAKYDEILKGWERPGQNAKKDAQIAVMFATQLGFLHIDD